MSPYRFHISNHDDLSLIVITLKQYARSPYYIPFS